jgi:hypothetical protein
MVFAQQTQLVSDANLKCLNANGDHGKDWQDYRCLAQQADRVHASGKKTALDKFAKWAFGGH